MGSIRSSRGVVEAGETAAVRIGDEVGWTQLARSISRMERRTLSMVYVARGVFGKEMDA
jgi:hypothetical protein